MAESGRLHPEQQAVVDTYLRTGDAGDLIAAPWPGSVIESTTAASHALRTALLTEVQRRASDVDLPQVPNPDELRSLTRQLIEPMVRGLFPRAEQEVVLELLEDSVVFLTPDNLEGVLRGESFDSSAWTLANLYLASVGAKLLSDEAPALLGLSQETTCYVTARYLEGRGRFEDYLVHEAAHVFHNFKGACCGLKRSSKREWLLPIAYAKRELFAYSCEVFSRILEEAASRKERMTLFEEYRANPLAIDGFDEEKHLALLEEAVAARNGWKRILTGCS